MNLRLPVLALVALPALALTTSCAAPAVPEDADEALTLGELGELGELDEPGIAPANTPIKRFVNLRRWQQVIVRRPGVWYALIVVAGTNVNLPCEASTVDFHLTYGNVGTTGAGGHYNRAYWSGSLTPWQTTTQLGLAAGAEVTHVFTRSIANAPANTPHHVWFGLDLPSGVTESDENDNFVDIYVTRVC